MPAASATFRAALSAAALLASGDLARPAEITVNDDDGKSIILIRGELAFGDERKFVDVALARPNALVVLEGPGGNLTTGLEIGRAIRLKGFVTAVVSDSFCASACALAWLGGQTRLMGATARIGFHAAYRSGPDGSPVPASTGNALVGAYLNQLGLPTSAILYISEAPPEGMNWLSPGEARSHGIAAITVPDAVASQSAPAQNPAPAPKAPVPAAAPETSSVPGAVDWTAQGEWVQTASRSTLSEAIAVAEAIRSKNPNTAIFRYQNGWFGVVIGPFSSSRGEAARAALTAAGEVPSDSLVTRGDKFAALVWGNPKARVAGAPAAATPSATRAIEFAKQFQFAWSSDNSTALAFLNRHYEGDVVYFGKAVPKAVVLKQKQKFAERWTVRKYTARPDTLAATCTPDPDHCTVTGIIDWDATAPGRSVRSTGSASFELRVRYRDGRPSITAETSNVLRRERAAVVGSAN
jgi:hypothetical protein